MRLQGFMRIAKDLIYSLPSDSPLWCLPGA